MSKTLKMIKDELPKTMRECDFDLLYKDICQAVKEVDKLKRDLAVSEELRLSAEAVIEQAIINERKACYEVAQNALCHAGLDMSTTNYIAGNIKARGLEI